MAIPDVEINLLKDSRIDWLDSNIDEMNALLPPLNEFVLPGGSEFTARVHIARSECRDSERAIIALSENEYVPNNHKKYINRLSDFLFVLSRIENLQKGKKKLSGNINNIDFNNTPINWNRVNDIINSCEKILLTTHENPDGDGLGAEVGLYYHLKEEGKDVKIINYSPLPKEYYFLNRNNIFESYNNELT